MTVTVSVLLYLLALALLAWLRAHYKGGRYMTARDNVWAAVRWVLPHRPVPYVPSRWWMDETVLKKVLGDFRPPLGKPEINRQGFQVIWFDDLEMFDWDFKDGVTLEEVLSRLEVRARQTFYAYRVYLTPGGIRAFRVGGQYTPEAFLPGWVVEAKQLGCDPAYVEITRFKQAWACRVGPKPGRGGDYVAAYWATIGEPEYTPEVLARIKQHDELIEKNRPAGVEVPRNRVAQTPRDAFYLAMEERPWEASDIRQMLADWDEENQWVDEPAAVVHWQESPFKNLKEVYTEDDLPF